MTEIKPCPKCGSINLNIMTEQLSGRQTIHCMDCHEYYHDCELNVGMDTSEVLDRWNEYSQNYTPTKPKTELKPCPFCGGQARIREDEGGFYQVTCTSVACEIHTFSFDDVSDAVERWNRRVNE